MQERHTEQDYRALLIADTPIIDVRAPIEFEHGAMPAAINLPLMNNDERAAVGALPLVADGAGATARGSVAHDADAALAAAGVAVGGVRDAQPKRRGRSPAWNQQIMEWMSKTGRPSAACSAAA